LVFTALVFYCVLVDGPASFSVKPTGEMVVLKVYGFWIGPYGCLLKGSRLSLVESMYRAPICVRGWFIPSLLANKNAITMLCVISYQWRHQKMCF
jgi:hypothetical protein